MLLHLIYYFPQLGEFRESLSKLGKRKLSDRFADHEWGILLSSGSFRTIAIKTP
ncbi:hypothetical protein H6G36_15825 [Anabaena minutissima FACHB-250]|nr:hypothetical protein [Anabaena minutissima FACHB-250]